MELLQLDLMERRRQTMIGVIDIGSNSLRLVIYDQVSRAPSVLFNEKVMCALGRGMNVTGRLNPAGVQLAFDNVERFVALSAQLGVRDLDVLATSAVRDAEDGPAFVTALQDRFGIAVRVVSGEEEALLAADGVRACFPDAAGLVGDLGGGSVELATIDLGDPPRLASLPIGPVRLSEGAADETKLRRDIDQAIASLEWIGIGEGRPFYAVGGAWRALARIHMKQVNYPLHVIQGYVLPNSEAETFLGVISRQSPKSLEKVVGVSKKRLETLPVAAYVLWRLLRLIGPSCLVFSAFGLREGHLFQKLSEVDRAIDPLLAATQIIALENPRFGGGGAELFRWTNGLFLDETPRQHRLRAAAALLSDIAWHEHPDYRGEQAFSRVLRMPVPGIDHDERVFIAAALLARYGGNSTLPEVERLIDPDDLDRAQTLGSAFRLAYTLTGGAPHLLQQTMLSLSGDVVTLTVPEHTAIYTGEAVRRRFDTLARSLHRRAMFCVGGSQDTTVSPPIGSLATSY